MTPEGAQEKCVTELWLRDPNRKTVANRTFAPGASALCVSPDGGQAVNIWREVTHAVPDDWNSRVAPFIAHVDYLIEDAAEHEQVLMWLAHLVQRPGEMPPWHVLMHTDGAQGVGRNWFAAVIGAMVRPYCALHIDIGALAGTNQGVGFNGVLATKIFCCVDELHASAFANGGRRMMEQLKVTLTAETRLINPKYGKQTVEFNRLRVLVLSNHCDAMPLDIDDRRFLVIRNPNTPKDTQYYTELYKLLADSEFIASVWQYLRSLDIANLTKGRAPMSEAKAALIEVTEPDFVAAVRDAVERTSIDLTTTGRVKGASGVDASWQIQQAMRAVGAVKYPKRVSVSGEGRAHVWILRNADKWMRASPAAIAGQLASPSSGF